jgi:hypothetical protein
VTILLPGGDDESSMGPCGKCRDRPLPLKPTASTVELAVEFEHVIRRRLTRC